MKPILFNTEMVKAILDGRKTVTRRVIKDVTGRKLLGMCVDGDRKDIGKIGFGTHESGVNIVYKKPPYQVGDVLYVRETWADRGRGQYMYKADYSDGEKFYRGDGEEIALKWHPSIHMPKEAARIFLKVTDVRVERLKDITNAEAIKEGAETEEYLDMQEEASICGVSCQSIRDYFGTVIWDSTIKKKDLHLYGWSANPYVWVIEFERCEKPESEEL